MIKPTGSNVLLKRMPPETRFQSSILILSETLQHDSFECEVLALGPGELMPNGSREPLDLSVGDRVVVFQGTGTETNKDEFLIDITGIEAVVEP